MNKSIATFLIGVVLTILLLLFVDWMGVSGPRWVILMLCGGLGLLLSESIFRQWSNRPWRIGRGEVGVRFGDAIRPEVRAR